MPEPNWKVMHAEINDLWFRVSTTPSMRLDHTSLFPNGAQDGVMECWRRLWKVLKIIKLLTETPLFYAKPNVKLFMSRVTNLAVSA